MTEVFLSPKRDQLGGGDHTRRQLAAAGSEGRRSKKPRSEFIKDSA